MLWTRHHHRSLNQLLSGSDNGSDDAENWPTEKCRGALAGSPDRRPGDCRSHDQPRWPSDGGCKSKKLNGSPGRARSDILVGRSHVMISRNPSPPTR